MTPHTNKSRWNYSTPPVGALEQLEVEELDRDLLKFV
jgi:hypothetical protein